MSSGMSTETRIYQINRRLGRGVNIIGYDPIWNDRAQGRFKERYFGMLKGAGFDHVRINLHPFKHMGAGPEHPIAPAYQNTLDWAVRAALDAGLMVILDMHEFGALGNDPHGLRSKYVATWRQLAERYRSAPDEVVFELLNEPNKALTPELWNEYYLEPYHLIRENHPDRALIIGPAWWNGIDHIDELVLPEADPNIIVTVHYYHPMPFTHQGAAWTEYVGRSGIQWLGTAEEREAVRADLAKAQAWAEPRRRPVYLGEFGAYDQADMASRARYTHHVARTAEQLGWSWGYWQFDSDFILYDIDREQWVEPIRDALVKD